MDERKGSFPECLFPPSVDWMQRAKCGERLPSGRNRYPVEWFFQDVGAAATQAKAVCFQCPVRIDCLEWAVLYEEAHGVWGGLSQNERRALIKWRKREGRSPTQRRARLDDLPVDRVGGARGSA